MMETIRRNQAQSGAIRRNQVGSASPSTRSPAIGVSVPDDRDNQAQSGAIKRNQVGSPAIGVSVSG
jgi:hypothetical protein